ncbi:MAG: YceH family protein [Desulfosarcinaceae bacterium]
MDTQLNPVEARILGSLMEKALSTPDYYPLSLNALVNACNQKSSRDPVVDYDEATVQDAVDELCKRGIAFQSRVSRVPKYEEHFSRTQQFIPKETAVVCVLLLRGPQTVGELRGRCARMYAFESLDEVAGTLDNLAERGFVRQGELLPGHKEARFSHLLGAFPDPDPKEADPDVAGRLEKVEAALEDMRGELEAIKQAFADFRSQFE